MFPEIADILGERGTCNEQPAAEADHEHDCCDLHESHPKLHLTVRTHIREVERRDDGKADERRDPLREIGQPEVHIDADRRKLCHGDDDVVEPVVPAG